MPQLFELVRMILCSWMTTIPYLSFKIREDAMPSQTRRFHLHQSHLLDILWRMTLLLTCPNFYATHLPRSTQDYHLPPSKSDALVSCHRFIRRHLPTVRMRSRRCMRVLQFHILFSHIPDPTRSWGSLQQASIRHSSVLQIFLKPWCQPQQRNENAQALQLERL